LFACCSSFLFPLYLLYLFFIVVLFLYITCILQLWIWGYYLREALYPSLRKKHNYK
jgi:hypothetical protein